MSPKFKNYLQKQLKNYLTVVVLGTTVLFIILTFLGVQVYTNIQLRADNRKMNTVFKNSVDSILDTIVEIDTLKDSQPKLYKDKVTELIYKSRSNSDIKFNFTILDQDLNLIKTNLYFDNLEILLKSPELNRSVERINEFEKKQIIENPIFNYSDNQKTVMTLIIKLDNNFYIIEPLYETVLDLEHKLNSNIIISDIYDNVLYDNTLKYKDSLGKLKINKQENVMYQSSIDLYTITNIKSRLITPTIMFYTITAAAIILMMLLKLLHPLLVRIVKGLDEPLDELLMAIEENKDGNLDYYIDSHHFEEFDKIYNEFNALMQSTKLLMIKNTELAQTKQYMEIKHLKNQFNPHFIYNSLESIRYEIIVDKENASEMLLSLGRLMQYSIENTDKEVRVEEDIKYVEDYLKLQKMRFKSRLSYNIELEEEIKEIMIPKLLIQPIIENSIKHNMNQVDALNIHISGRSNGNDIEFLISDDGVGINKEDMNKITQMLEHNVKSEKNLGIYNIDRTLKLLYGLDYGLKFDNTFGLTVKVIIPRSVIK